MIYSFTVRGADKAAALALAKEQMDEVVRQQPVHVADRDAALAAAATMVAVMPDDATKDVVLALNGYVSAVMSEGEVVSLTAVSQSCSVSYVAR